MFLVKFKYDSRLRLPSIEAQKVEERSDRISEEEVHAQTEMGWGTDLDIQYIRQIYRDHGWPNAFRKDEIGEVCEKLSEALDLRGRTWW